MVFSAHGVPKSVPAEAEAREMIYVDATCPLVSKVHIEAERHHEAGRQIVMIGHAGHPETVGTMGQLPAGRGDAGRDGGRRGARSQPRDPARLAFVTQTTLSVDDTAEIVEALRARFPAIVGPRREDICYATTNRQEAVKAMAPEIDALLVIGAPNSSNSQRLVEVGRRAGCRLCPARPARRRHRLARPATAPAPSASPPAPRRPRCWSRRWSTPFAPATT